MVQDATRMPQKTRSSLVAPRLNMAARSSQNSRRAVLCYIDRADKANRRRGDIDKILLANISQHSPLERGIVGPTGASSIVNASVLGPLFATWGAVAGYRIITGARDASAYLRLVSIEIEKLEGELQTLQSAADSVHAPANTRGIALRLQVLAQFRAGVARATREQRFNQTVPGFIQLGASVGIMAVGINSIPTLGNAGTLLNAAGTLALGAASGGVLCVYGGLSLARSLAMTLDAWRRPKRDPKVASKRNQRAYLRAYNARVGMHRLFHTLNSVSWAGFVGGCGCMIGIAAGAALSHGAVIAAVVLTALAVVVWDALWGERCAPRNALTPHIDRNHLDTVSERAALWSLLKENGKAKVRLERNVLAALPAKDSGLSPRQRYAYAWKQVPWVGGAKRLARWAAATNNDATKLALLGYLSTHMAGEDEFFVKKLRLHSMAAKLRKQELLDIKGKVPLSLEAGKAYDEAITGELRARSEAIRALRAELEEVHTKATRDKRLPKEARLNRLLASFIAVNELESEVFSGRDIEQDALSFNAAMRPATWFAKARPTRIALAARGVQAIEHKGLTDKQRRRFIHALLSDRQRQYEMDALFSIEAGVERP